MGQDGARPTEENWHGGIKMGKIIYWYETNKYCIYTPTKHSVVLILHSLYC